MVVVRANVVSATASSYSGISGNVAYPAHSFQSSPGTGMYLGSGNTIGFSSNSQSVATISSNGTLSASRLQGNLDGSYVDGNLEGEFVIVSGSIDCATNLSGTIPQINLPQTIGNVLTTYVASNGTAASPAFAFGSNSGAYAAGGNVGISVNGIPKALVHPGGLTVYGAIDGLLVANASLLTSGTLDTRRLPTQVVVDAIVSNGAQFASLQAGNAQFSKFNATSVSASSVTANIMFASAINAGLFSGTLSGNVFGNVSGNGLGIDQLNASNIIGILPHSAFPSTLLSDVSGNLAGDGIGIANINAANVTGVLPGSAIPNTLDLLNLRSNNAQFSSVQSSAVQASVVDADTVRAATIRADTLVSSNAALSGSFSGNVSGNVFGNVSGNGAYLQNINAASLAFGTLDSARLPANAVFGNSVTAPFLSGNGYGVSGIDASNVETGTLDNSRLPENIDVVNLRANGVQTVGIQTTGIQTSKLDATLATISTLSANTIVSNNFRGNVFGNISGIVSGNISGNGYGLVINASAINTGTLDNARLAPTVIVQNITGNVSGNGFGLSGMNAANITEGQLDTARLPANVVVSSVKTTSSFAETSQANATQVASGQFLSIQAANVQVQKFTACTATVASISTSNIASPSFTFPHSNTGMVFSNANVVTFSANGQQIAQLSETFTGLGKNVRAFAGSICLNSSGTQLAPAQPGFFVKPIRSTVATTPVLTFNSTTNEVNYSSSTRRIKTNIVDIQQDTSTIFDVRPREFDSLEDHSHHIGFIAEEVDAVDPAFAWSLDGQIQGINWFTMLTYALAELRKMRAELDELKCAKS